MKVLIIQGGIDRNLPTGEEVVISNDIKYLKKNGIDVIYEQIKIPSSGWGSIVGKAGGLIWSFSNYKKVKSAIGKYKPDILHFHTIVPYISFSVIHAVSKMKVPVVQTLHNGRWLCVEGGYFRSNTFCDDCVNSYGWLGVVRGCGHGRAISLLLFLNNYFVRRFGFLFNKIDHFIAVSEFTKKQHINSSFPKQKITVRNNGFNFTSLVSEVVINPLLKKEGIVFAGKVSVAKGALVLRYLIPRLNCTLKIIGNGPELDMLKSYCIDKSFNHIEFFGKVDNNKAIEVIKNSILTIVPSQCGDSFPTVAVESMAVGTPVLASNLGGLPDLIKKSGGGRLVQYDDNSKFLYEIESLLSNQDELNKLAKTGMAYVKHNISLNKKGDELLAIYNHTIEEFKAGKK